MRKRAAQSSVINTLKAGFLQKYSVYVFPEPSHSLISSMLVYTIIKS